MILFTKSTYKVPILFEIITHSYYDVWSSAIFMTLVAT